MFKKMRKLLPIVSVLALVATLALTGCSAATTASAAAPAADTNTVLGQGGPQGAGQGRGQGQGGPQGAGQGLLEITPPPNATAADLSDEEIADLLHMREEEKLARDVYLALYDKWGAQVFSNIARSEQMHMDRIGTLLNAYGIDDPVAQTGDQRGVFSDPKLQDLYNQLVEKGSSSLVDALTVGATIEDLDIKDLDEAIARTTHPDIQTVYDRLRTGSYHHMNAFVSNLKANGADYSPQFISVEEYQRILESTPGQGAGMGHGGEMGHGAGGPHGNCQATATPAP